jgi:hypothetical protein
MKFNQNKKRIDPRYFLNEKVMVEYWGTPIVDDKANADPNVSPNGADVNDVVDTRDMVRVRDPNVGPDPFYVHAPNPHSPHNRALGRLPRDEPAKDQSDSEASDLGTDRVPDKRPLVIHNEEGYTEWVPAEMRKSAWWSTPGATEKYDEFIRKHGSHPADPGAPDKYGPMPTGGAQPAEPVKPAETEWVDSDPKRVQRMSAHLLLKQQYDFYESGGRPGGACPSGKCVGAEVMPYNSYLTRATQAKRDIEAVKKARLEHYRTQKAKQAN